MLSHLSSCEHADPVHKATALRGSKKENRHQNPRMSRNQQLTRHAVLQPGPPNGVVGTQLALNITHTSSAAPVVSTLPRTMGASTLPYMMWDPPKQQEFAEDLCKLFIACNVSWNSANNPELLLFFSKYVPEAKIPDRRVLSGQVLDTLVLRVEKEMKDQVAGKLGIGQCDGWKTGAKASIISTSITVESTVSLHFVRVRWH